MSLPAVRILAGCLSFVLPGSAFAGGPAGLAGFLPEDTAAVLHIRSVPEIRKQWEHNPLARTWAEPGVQAFFAPAIERFKEENAGGLAELIQSETGLTSTELLDLLPGEIVVSLLALEDLLDDESVADPPILILAELGEDPSAMEELLVRLMDDDEQLREEEFQGVTLRVIETFPDESEGPVSTASWAIVDRTLLFGVTKVSVQQGIDNLKRGGAREALSDEPGFEAIRRENTDAQVSLLLNLQAILKVVLEGMREAETQLDPEAPSALDMVGMTPDGLVDALGLQHLSWVYAGLEMGQDSTRATSGLKWSERPDLMRLIAYGPPPAPRPSFVPDTWTSVSAARFSIGDAYRGLKDILSGASPALSGLIETRIAEFNQALGVDIERDLFGNLGDEIVQAESVIDGGSEENLVPTDQFYSVSINDADTARRMIDAALTLAPGLAEALTSREYLGETIHSMSPPSLPDLPQPRGFSYAVTRQRLFVGIGDSAMVETAIQGLEGASNAIWDSPEVAASLAPLPSGESLIAYQDTKTMIVAVFDLFVRGAGFMGDPEEEEPIVDPAQKPSPEIISRHWGPSASAIYLDPDGIRSVGWLKHGEVAPK